MFISLSDELTFPTLPSGNKARIEIVFMTLYNM